MKRGSVLVSMMLVTLALHAGEKRSLRPSLEVPASLAEATAVEPAAIRTWRRPLRFGAWEVRELRRGNTPSFEHGLTIGSLSAESARARQRYGFTLLQDGEALWKSDCFWLASERGLRHQGKKSVTELTLGQRSAVRCTLTPKDGPPVVMEVETSAAPRPAAPDVASTGRFGDDWSVEASYRLAGVPIPAGEATGYLLSRDGVTLAAVETIDGGRILFAPQLSAAERSELAPVAAALLLQPVLDEVLPER